MSWIDVLGVSLSVLAALLFVLLLTDWRRRTGRGGRLVRWVWPPLLTASFLGGLYGTPIRTLTNSEPAVAEYAVPAETRRSTVRMPFYVLTRTEERPPFGAWTLRETTKRLQLPWILLLGSGIYVTAARVRRCGLRPRSEARG
ncbi:MAG: hypothetical protein KAJ67_03400 [Gemmatimonadetes bacterium]|nr:hypothetical protein [Gemmatimonadota bacterium]